MNFGKNATNQHSGKKNAKKPNFSVIISNAQLIYRLKQAIKLILAQQTQCGKRKQKTSG